MSDQSFRELGVEVAKATAAVDAQRVAAKEAKKAADRKDRNLRIGVFVAACVGLVGVFAGFRAQDAIDKANASRDEARIARCRADNDVASKINHLGDAMRNVVNLAVPSNPERTPEQQARVEEFLANSNAALDEARVPARDCSPEAIEEFYEQQGMAQ